MSTCKICAFIVRIPLLVLGLAQVIKVVFHPLGLLLHRNTERIVSRGLHCSIAMFCAVYTSGSFFVHIECRDIDIGLCNVLLSAFPCKLHKIRLRIISRGLHCPLRKELWSLTGHDLTDIFTPPPQKKEKKEAEEEEENLIFSTCLSFSFRYPLLFNHH